MMKFLLPLLLAIVGVVGGVAIGIVMKPEPVLTEEEKAAIEEKQAAKAALDKSLKAADSEYFQLTDKLVAPFKRGNGRSAFVAVHITLELAPGKMPFAETHEPKVVDAFLRVVVGFAATGAFDDHGHAPHTLEELNKELLKTVRAVLGDDVVRSVLIANLLTSDA